MKHTLLALCVASAAAALHGADAPVAADAPNRVIPALDPVFAEKVEAALPAKARASAKKKHLVLVTARTEGFFHKCIPTALYAVRLLGEKTGAYQVEIDNEMKAFTPENLARYDAIIFVNSTQLKFKNPAHRQALLDYVRSGKGLVGIHAASDNFPGWLEGQALMGGVFHSHPWTGGDTVAVKLDEPEHVLNEAFGGRGFWIQEEIYQIVGPYGRDRQRVLMSLDMSKPQNDRPAAKLVRPDRDFPIGWLKREGKGRVFYSSLGHNDVTFWTPEVLQHYLDGIQFALGDLEAPAQPTASLAKAPVPALAPPEPQVLQGPAVVRRLQSPDTLKGLASLEEGGNPALLLDVSTGLRLAGEAARVRFADDVVALSGSAKLSVAARRALSRWLGLIGSPRCLPALEAWASQPESADEALRALAAIPGAEAEKSLLALLGSAPDPLKVSVLDALGRRSSAGAVAPASALVGAADPSLAGAALDCLGRIGSAKALAALVAAKPAPALEDARSWALVAAASSLVRSKAASEAFPALQDLLKSAKNPVLRQAAARTLLDLPGDAGLAQTFSLLSDPDADFALKLAPAWVRAAAQTPAAEAIAKLATALPSLAMPVQRSVLATVEQLGHPAFLPVAKTALASTDQELRLAAIAALGTCGRDATITELLLARMDTLPEQPALITALSRLRAEGLDARLRELAAKAAPGQLAAYLGIAANRVDRAMMPLVLAAAAGQQADSRQAAFKALPGLVRTEDFETLLGLRSVLKTAPERRYWQDAFTNAVRLSSNGAATAALIKAQLPTAAQHERATFIIALSNLEAPAALEILKAQLADPSAEIRKDAVRALSSARNEVARELLIVQAAQAADATEKILSLRGYLDATAALADLSASNKVKACRRAWACATRPEEREAIAAAVAPLKGKEADAFNAEIKAFPSTQK
jgi:type 1 glutamine amidotransferase/HEAT repeat protein